MRNCLRRNALVLALISGFIVVTANSARAEPWDEYSYSSDGFVISAPFAPALSKADFGTPANPLPSRILTWKFPDGAVVLVTATDYSGTDSVDASLNSVAQGEVQSLKNGRIVSQKSLVQQGVNGIECVMEGDDYHARTRIFRQGNRIWNIYVLSSTGKPIYDQTDRLFASFRFLQTP